MPRSPQTDPAAEGQPVAASITSTTRRGPVDDTGRPITLTGSRTATRATSAPSRRDR